ncbi:MAG: HEAT repeat domain-containing protein [Gemmatimonadaceae bacterium]
MTDTLSLSFGGLAGMPMLVLLAKATLILVLALATTVVMQRASAGSRHLVWLVTLVGLLLVPALTAWAPFPVRLLPATVREAVSFQTGVSTGSGAGSDKIESRTGKTLNVIPEREQRALSTPPTSTRERLSAMSAVSILVSIWGLVVLAIAASLAYAALVVRRIVKTAKPLDSNDWLAPMWEVADRLGLEEPPRLLRSEQAKMPFACGFLNATIVLPAECDEWTLDRRRAVLLHELAHVRRHDLVGHTLGRLACAFYWFHPLVWTAAKQLRSESERACDDLALSCGARATDYAEHLLDIVTSVRRDSTPSVALAMARRKEFEGRMLAILDPELRHSSPSRRQSASLIGSLALISILVGAAAPAPRLERAVQRGPVAGNLDLAPQQSPVKGYPDSREIIGGSKTHFKEETSFQQLQHTITTLSQHTATNEHTDMSLNGTGSSPVAAPAPVVTVSPVGATASASAGAPAFAPGNSAALLRIIQGQSPVQKGKDDRPILLANVLRTDTSASLRRIAAWGLAEYGDAAVAVEALSTALRRDPSAGVREMAAWALGESEDSPTAVDALTTALRSDASVQVRARSAWALGSIGARGAADALAAALSDANPEVRERAAWAIGNAEPRQAPHALIALLSDKEPRLREIAAWALYQIEDPASIPALEAALHAEPNKELQIAYIRALAAVGEKSVDALRGLLESKDPEIKAIAVRALAGGHATGPWPWPWPEPRPSP